MVIAVTELNNVYALDATTGLPIWSRTDIGPPVPTTPCGGFNPTGITGTPVVDLTSRRLFFDALINGSPTKHFIYSLNVDTGATTPGWPVDVNATAIYNGIPFVSLRAGRPRWTGAGERDCVHILLRLRRRLRQLSRLGCWRGHQQPDQCSWLGYSSDRWRHLGTRRRCQRRHKHVRDHGEHVQYGRQLDGRRSDHSPAGWADLDWSAH